MIINSTMLEKFIKNKVISKILAISLFVALIASFINWVSADYNLGPNVTYNVQETSGYDGNKTIPEQGNRVIRYVVQITNNGPGWVNVEKAAFSHPVASWQATDEFLDQSLFTMTGKTRYEQGESGVTEFFYNTARKNCGRVQIDAGFRDANNGNLVFIGTMVNYGTDCVPTPVVCNENALVTVTQPLPATMTSGQTAQFKMKVRDTGDTRFYHGSYFQFVQKTNVNIQPTYGHISPGMYPNNEQEWAFTVTAPQTLGSFQIDMQMVHRAGADYIKPNGNTCVPPSADVYFGNIGSTFSVVQTPPGNPTLTIAKTALSYSSNLNNRPGYAETVIASPGAQVDFKMVVTNTGSATANNVVVTDTLPAHFTGAPTNFNLGNMAAGSIQTVILTATVGTASEFPTGDSTHINTATASGSNVSSVSDTAQVVVRKDLVNTPPQGYLDQADCNIIGGWATDSDTPNSSVTVQIYMDGPVGSGTLITTTQANLYRSDVGPHAYQINTPSAFKDGGSHTVYVYALDTTTNVKTLLTNSPKTVICPVGQPALSIQKTVRNITAGQSGFQESVTANPGDSVEFRMIVTNTGNASINNVNVVDTLPNNFTANGNINFSLGVINVGESKTVNLYATLASENNFPQGNSTWTNSATASGSGVSSVSDTALVVVFRSTPGTPTVSITKLARNVTVGQTAFGSSVSANPNDQVEFRLTVSVSGVGTANNIVVTDTLPGNFYANGATSFNLGSMSAGSSQSVNLLATAASEGSFPYGSSTWTNTANVTSSNAGNSSASAVALVNRTSSGSTGLTIYKTVRNVTVGQTSFVKSVTANPGEQVEFRMQVTNTGNATANNVVITDTLPSNFYASGNTTFNIGSLSAGQSNTVNLMAIIAGESNFPTGNSSWVNNAYATASNLSQVSDTAIILVNKQGVINNPSISITKSVRNITQNQSTYQSYINAQANDRVSFRIQVTNNGNNPAQDVRLTDNLPTGLVYVNGTLTVDGSYNSGSFFSGSQLYLGSINSGSSRIIIFEATTGSGSNTYVNSATATASNTQNVTATATVYVSQVLGGNVDLVLSKRAYNSTKGADATTVIADADDLIVYTLSVENRGNATATNYVFEDDLTDIQQLAMLSEFGGGAFNMGSLSIRWPAISIPAASKGEKIFTVKVRNPIPTNYDYVITNTYGNTTNIQVRKPQVQGAYVAPKTGNSVTLNIIFALLVMIGFALYRTGKLKQFAVAIRSLVL